MDHKNTLGNRTASPLQCDVLEDVTLLPMFGDIAGPIYTYALGAFHQNKALPHVHRVAQHARGSSQLPCIEAQHFSSQEVIYGGIFFMHWGHFLVETLQRLWYAKRCNLPIVWAGATGNFFAPKHLSSWQRDIFRLLGIDNEHIFLREPTQFAKIHFPEPGFTIATHLHPEHARYMGFYHQPTTQGKYVYFSRSKVRGCANEEHVERLLQDRGWEIIHPQELSVEDQLKSICTAEVCCMVSGSAQHTLLLTRDLGTRMVVIPREHDTTYNCIANIKSNNYFLLNLQKKGVYALENIDNNSSFTLNINEFEYILDETNNFTRNLHAFPDTLIKPDQLEERNIITPACYFDPPPSVNDKHALFYRAHFLYQQKKYAEAFAICQQLQKENVLESFMHETCSKTLQYYHILSGRQIHLPIEKLRHRRQSLEGRIKATDTAVFLYEQLTQVLLAMGDVQAAIDLHHDFIEKYPQWSEPYTQLAAIYSMQDYQHKSIFYAQKAVEVEPHSLKCKIELVHHLLKIQDFDACKKLMTGLLLKFPFHADTYVCAASIHEAEGCFDKAEDLLNKALEVAPHSLNALRQKTQFLHRRGKVDEANEVLQDYLKHNKRKGESYIQCAHLVAATGDYTLAIEYAHKSVEFEPRNFVCRANLSEYYFLNKDYENTMKIMNDAMHENPFWSEPHVRNATVHAAKGDLNSAIDCARKAVAVEPYSAARKEELEAYRVQRLREKYSEEQVGFIQDRRLKGAYKRIQAFIDIFYAQSYLEVGVCEGDTFLHIDVPFKIAVDPTFRFNTHLHANDNTHFYPETSDEFFKHFPERSQRLQEKYHSEDFKFDIIYLDGLHTFEQTLRDFENSLAYAHEKTVWIFDDTVPSNCFAAMPCITTQEQFKDYANMFADIAWQGDVFKTIFAIHDMYPDFSYCTQINNDNPQTVLWRTEKPTKRTKVFNSAEHIAQMRYEDFIQYAWVLYLVNDEDILKHIYSNTDPLQHKTGEEAKLVIKPVRTIEFLKKELDALMQAFETLSHKQNTLTVENFALKRLLEKKNSEA